MRGFFKEDIKGKKEKEKKERKRVRGRSKIDIYMYIEGAMLKVKLKNYKNLWLIVRIPINTDSIIRY